MPKRNIAVTKLQRTANDWLAHNPPHRDSNLRWQSESRPHKTAKIRKSHNGIPQIPQ